MSITKRAAIAAVLLSPAVCACSEYRTRSVEHPPIPAFSATSTEHATICVFRPHGLGRSVIAPVSDNGAIVGATDGSSHFCYLAEPGMHRVRTADAPQLELTVSAGTHYFVMHDLNVGPDKLTRITPESARQLAAYSDYALLRATPRGIPVPAELAVARAEPARTSSSVRLASDSAKRPAKDTRENLPQQSTLLKREPGEAR
jgi:hypothetical protein